MKKLISFIIFCLTMLLICGCFKNRDLPKINQDKTIVDSGIISNPYNVYQEVFENSFTNPMVKPNSYFSMNSFTASYSQLRNCINKGKKISSNVIRTNELINYFSYDFEEPNGDDTFNIVAQMGNSSWNKNSHLLTIGIKTKEEKLNYNKGNNFVLLIDISGSMSMPFRLELVKESFNMLVDSMSENDYLSIITYENKTNILIEGEKVIDKEKIKNKINSLEANGGTYAEDAIKKAYEIAKNYYINGGNNRVIIASDGDFNVGAITPEELKELVHSNLDSGIYLTTLGFGINRYKDITMETLAKYGNGNYAYIDTIDEAKKVLIDEADKTLVTVAKDVKSMVNFNPNLVESYRLIGYENQILTEEDFHNHNKDTGDVGSGYTTMVCYELLLKKNVGVLGENLFNIVINYKDAKTNESKDLTKSFKKINVNNITDDFFFVRALVEFSLIIKNSEYKEEASLNNILRELETNCQEILNKDVFKKEFYTLVKKTINNNLIIN